MKYGSCFYLTISTLIHTVSFQDAVKGLGDSTGYRRYQVEYIRE
jgi:hypothetical protein